ncbi:MAG TPA: alpha-amylase family protein [Pedobacter sp.]|nr:alpha-amylase family protein [Pedobacter sp.]
MISFFSFLPGKQSHAPSLLAIAYIMLPILGCHQEQDQQPQENQTITTPSWYANSVIYNLDVETFQDSDGDGRGDFRGLTRRLDYLKDLGVTAIWLAPFQPTPDQDDGYDITDFYGIDSRLGTSADFHAFMKAAKSKNMKVLMDLVINHTSVEHPWFKAARADTTSVYHKWYVWAKKQPKDFAKGMVFPGVQNETWTYDEPAKSYYFHRFYDFQPDLNFQNEQVREMAISVLTYWLKQGMDGFRLDAVPFVIDIPETGARDPAHMYRILTRLNAAVKKVNTEAILLGEANVTADENAEYFGKDATRLKMMFNFYANQHLFYALAKNDPASYIKAMREFRFKPSQAQWVYFLRNHDEIDLKRLSNTQRGYVFERFGPEPTMQIYERGIRRRLAPMLADTRLLRMAYSILFSSPGAQMIRYGEEIGMGDDLTLRERLSVRTPMQWDTSANAGFSHGAGTFRPVIAYGDYSFQKINVRMQSGQHGSLLEFVRKMISLRNQHPEIGLGSWEIYQSAELLMMEYKYKDKHLLTVHNFQPEQADLQLPKELREKYDFMPLLSTAHPDRLEPHGFQWFDLKIKQ